MNWESFYGSSAQYEELLREIERENYARRLWANTHPRRNWWGFGQSIERKLAGWLARWTPINKLRDRTEGA